MPGSRSCPTRCCWPRRRSGRAWPSGCSTRRRRSWPRCCSTSASCRTPPARPEADPAALGRQAAGLTEQVRETLDGVRRLAADLRPRLLDDLGLVPAVQSLALEWEEQTGLPVDLRASLPPDARVPPAVGIAVYRMAQEALANVARHAQASRVRLTLAAGDGELAAEVHDDGRGLPVAPVGGRGAPAARPVPRFGLFAGPGAHRPRRRTARGEVGAGPGDHRARQRPPDAELIPPQRAVPLAAPHRRPPGLRGPRGRPTRRWSRRPASAPGTARCRARPAVNAPGSSDGARCRAGAGPRGAGLRRGAFVPTSP